MLVKLLGLLARRIRVVIYGRLGRWPPRIDLGNHRHNVKLRRTHGESSYNLCDCKGPMTRQDPHA